MPAGANSRIPGIPEIVDGLPDVAGEKDDVEPHLVAGTLKLGMQQLE